MDEKGAIVVLQMIEAHGKLAVQAKELAIISLERHVKRSLYLTTDCLLSSVRHVSTYLMVLRNSALIVARQLIGKVIHILIGYQWTN